MPWLVIAVLLAGVTVLVVFLVRLAAEECRVRKTSWRDYATSRGLAWKEAAGPWYRRTPDAIEGTVEGAHLRLDTYVVSTGKSHVTFTRVASELARDVPAKITVSRRHFLTGLGERLGMKTVRTGDATFDRRMVVRAKDTEDARRAIDASVRARILEVTRSITVRLDHRMSKVTWRGAEKDPRVLDAACRVAAALARAVV